MKPVIVFATANENKTAEVRELLKDIYEVKSLIDIGCSEDIPETTNTLEGNAKQKADYVKEKYGYDCFADDTGLEVEAFLVEDVYEKGIKITKEITERIEVGLV